ncbi:VCBS domain-containing protein [Bradyrhizobium sp. 39]|uniref:VCBS domain-containing protein n=1 Tax=unclassified Bradyrhizobium TaxID=2631580 RepID=UPI0031F8D8ED
MPEGAVVVADPNLIFHGEYKRAGADLVVSHEGHEFVVHDYFRGDKRAAIASPDGAHLTGDIVNALTGHVQYAQAASGIAAAQVIGHVTKLSGSATAVRNGVSIVLNNGDNVEKGDVVSTGGDSTLGITFIDGTVFGLSSNARMVLNEMVYDPNGSNNSSLLSLVAGTITFVAGETAKHGDMKIDTPVATMGIRGTAVLNQINFVVPAGGGDPQPQVSFQVLVEPNGTTGSYILFDKVTLLPIATVNQAGQMIQISGGNVSISNALMSPDIQKLITDVFTLKFTDNNSNTKLTQNFTDSITQTGNVVFIKTDTGATATATFTHLPEPGSQGPGHDPATSTRIPGPPLARSLDLNGNVQKAFPLTERADTTGDTTHYDTISGLITFDDQNLGDRPTVSMSVADAPNYVYKDAGLHDVTGSLTALQKQDIAATLINIDVVANGGNTNHGSAVWTYTIPDHVFDFLAAGETLTLTYKVRVNNNFSVNPEASTIDITITITGTNDKPVITTSVPVIIFEGGTSVPGGPLTSEVPTSGTLTFKDVDLTDTHTVAVKLTSATLPDGSVPPGPLAAFQSAMSVAIAAGADSKGSGTGTINWSLADLPVYLADFIPKGEVLTLVYTVTLKDAQGATSQQTITVTITGTDAPAVVWIATDHAGAPSGGFWKDAANWETGTVPTINDDVIVITDQLHGLTPSYPVTIDAAAYAKSITMNDYDTTVGHTAPEVINKSALTIAGEVSLKADSKLTNFTASTISVGGKAEFLDSSVLTNAGDLTLKGGGDFAEGTTITNSGTIELFGGTLKTLAGINNAGGTLKADAGTTLIVDTATISGGTVTIAGTLELDGSSVLKDGTLNNSGAVNVKGTADFAHETVSNTSGGTIKVLANGWLTIDQGSTVANAGNVTVDANGKLTVNGATISGTGTATGNGEIDLTGAAVLSGGILNNNAAFKVSGSGNALDHETITNVTTGTIEVLANGALTIDQGSTVANAGNVTVDANGKLTVNGATISGPGTVTVTGNGEIDLTGAAVLSGGILNNNAAFKVSGTGNALDHETITNAATGTIEVLANGALTIDQGSTVANAGNVTVDANGKLTVNGATISGGTIDGLGTIDVTGASKIDGGATLSTATVSANAQLTLDGITVSGSAITDNGGIELDNTVKLKDGASIQGGAVANTGLLEIAGAATLLNDVVTNTGTVTVDGGQTLTLSGTEISGGAVNGTGTIDVIGSSKIDKSATLSTTAVTVESGVILTLDDVTIAGTAIANHGTVKVDASSKLTLNGASLTGGALTVSGTLNSTGTTAITDANISNNYLIEATLGALTLLATTSASSIANDGILRANGAELDINGEAVANTGTLAAINHGTLKLIGMTVTDTGSGHVSVESGSILDLQGATIDGGTVTIAGTLESTGTSAINNADITNTGTITVTSGTLTIDPAILHTINNHNLIQANGGELDISGDLIVNSADIMAVHGGTLKLASVIVTNSGGTIAVDGSSKLYLSDVSINGGSLSNAGNLYSVSGSNTVSAMVTNTGTIEVQAGTLNLAGGLSGVGSVIIDNGATLELAGATAQTIAFAGGTDTLQLDKVAGQSFTGTIAGQSTKAGTFTIKGAADITTSSGDALDFTASGGTSAAPADIVLTPTGALTGAANGVAITQNGTGDISFTATGDIKGLAGHGIWLRDSATGAGDITVNDLTGKATGTGANSVGVLVENLNSANAGGISITQLGGAVGGAYGIDATTQGNGDIAIDAGGTITGSSVYGIRARSYGSGSETVTTEAGSAVTSGSSAIIAVNRANSIDASDGSTITVTTYGTINSGSSLNQSGNTPAGIQAGYTGATTGSTANTNVNGTVTISNHANITAAAGYGIDAYNYGNGDVRVTSFAGTTISVSGTQSVGINASALSGGTGDVTVTLGENVTISGATSYGIRAYSIDAGDVSVTMANGDSITSGSTGIVAVNYAAAIADGLGSTISVEAHGTIHSGSTSNNDGTTPGGIIAGYKPGGTGTFSNAVKGDVTVTSDATIIADAGYGIEAFTWGAGNLTVTTGATSSITAAGTAIGAFDHGGGDVSVTNNGSAIGAVGVSAVANGSGDVTIVNHGGITSTSLAGISVTQNEMGATGSTHITNTGSIVAPSAHAAIFIQENATGIAQIDNSATGTIGPAVASTVTAATYAIVETGGHITINNAGHINGNISVASATFNNELGGTWTVAGSGIFGNASSIVNHGAIDLHGASISGSGLSVENYATIDSWGTASITGTVANTGSIEVHAGTLTLFGSLSGAGSVTVDVGAWLKLEGTVTATQTITLDGDGAHLQIDASTFGGSIAALSAHDTIDLSSIVYDDGTSATYNTAAGELVVSDAHNHTITLKLAAGVDYSNYHFAGSDDGHGGTLITINSDDDKPVFDTATATLTATVPERENTTGSSALDPTPTAATGSIDFKDVDLTDRPTAEITGQSVTWLDTDGTTPLTLTGQEAALEHALTLLQQTGKNNGTATWSYSIADGALDFLGENQSAKVVSTVTLDDHQGKTDTAEVTVTIIGKNDAPAITAETNDHSGADLLETNTELVKHGTLTVSDADATDHVTVAVDHLDIYLDGVLQTDYVGEPSSATLLDYLAVQPGDILNGSATNAAFTWDFNSGSEAFDFLAAGHTLSLQYTIVPDDSHTPTGAGNGVLTFNIAGSNDAPTLGDATLASVSGDNRDPAGSKVSDLFAGKFHDADDGASFQAVAVSADDANSDQGVWQYEIAGSNQWVDIAGVSDTTALVLSTDTLVRFVPADGFTGTPASLGVHAIDNTYTGDVTTDVLTPATIDLTATGTGGATPVSHELTAIDTKVTAPPASGPVINTDHFQVWHTNEPNTDSITGLSVVDTDSGAATDDFKMTAVTGQDPDSSVDPGTACGNLDDINSVLADGVTYSPGATPPATDQITLTVTDKTTGLFDTVHFIFNEAGETSQGVSLEGTSGKDVIFATETGDTLTGGGGRDQFVFSPNASGSDSEHTITDFATGLDKIDLRQFSDVGSIDDLSFTPQSDDTLVLWSHEIGQRDGEPVLEQESILLKNVTASLKASDFIFHVT